jgi:hypothetical protein
MYLLYVVSKGDECHQNVGTAKRNFLRRSPNPLGQRPHHLPITLYSQPSSHMQRRDNSEIAFFGHGAHPCTEGSFSVAESCRERLRSDAEHMMSNTLPIIGALKKELF